MLKTEAKAPLHRLKLEESRVSERRLQLEHRPFSRRPADVTATQRSFNDPNVLEAKIGLESGEKTVPDPDRRVLDRIGLS